MTPLLDACHEHPSFIAIQQLIELGADISARNKVSQNAHSALVLELNFCRINKMPCIWLYRSMK